MTLSDEQRKQIEKEAEELWPERLFPSGAQRRAYTHGATTRALACQQKDEQIKRLRQGLENVRRCCSSCGSDPVFRDSVIKDIDSIAEETLNL